MAVVAVLHSLADQTLSFPIAQDVADFDPALISSGADVDILRNVFSGLYRFDPKLREVPDLALGQPVVSADGLTYTFHLRQDGRFWNGDPITADDFIYSWDRAAAKQGDYAGLFGVIAGYADVASGKTAHMSGLSKLDDYTLTVTLAKRAGYFLTEASLWPFWVVDRKVISSAGDAAWFMKPDTLVGSGPFRLTARTPGQSMDFAPVAGWYGGKTGSLTGVHVEVMADTAAQVAQFESGVFSLLGFGRQPLAPAAATRYTSDAKLKDQLVLVPAGTTFWIGFNLKSGPFASVDGGRAGRRVFSEAIDRSALADAVCNQKTTCVAATGGVISKGLQGYLGDGADYRGDRQDRVPGVGPGRFEGQRPHLHLRHEPIQPGRMPEPGRAVEEESRRRRRLRGSRPQDFLRPAQRRMRVSDFPAELGRRL